MVEVSWRRRTSVIAGGPLRIPARLGLEYWRYGGVTMRSSEYGRKSGEAEFLYHDAISCQSLIEQRNVHGATPTNGAEEVSNQALHFALRAESRFE